MEEGFRFWCRAWFRIAPGPDWAWAPAPAPSTPDTPDPQWPTPEYLEMKEAVSAALLRDAPTLNYTDPYAGPRSLVVRDVTSEVPSRADETGTAMTVGTVAFDSACFTPGFDGGPGQALGDWLEWVEVSYDGGTAAWQLQQLEVIAADPLGAGEGEGEGGASMCDVSSAVLYAR